MLTENNNSSGLKGTLNESFTLTKYITLFKREKWKILIITAVFITIWSAVIIRTAPKPIYEVSSLIRFSDERNVATIRESSGLQSTMTKLRFMKSRKFLGKIVDTMKLQLRVHNDYRKAVVDSFKLADKYQTGNYIVKKENQNLIMYYSNEDLGIEEQKVYEVAFDSIQIIDYPEFYLRYKKGFWNSRDKMSFNIKNKMNVIENLKQLLAYKILDRRVGSMVRITLSGKDPYLITATLNNIVKELEISNLNIKKSYTRKVINILAEQLAVARLELDSVEQNLKNFRLKYPWVGLTPDMSSVISEISASESEISSINFKTKELSRLIAEFNKATNDSKYTILSQILTSLLNEEINTVPTLQSEYNSLMAERTRLLNNYSSEHPYVYENLKKLNNLGNDIILETNRYIALLKNKSVNAQKNLTQGNFRVQNLPAHELELAELQRKRNVADELYSDIMVRYNKAKLADAVEISDISIVDYAVVPKPQGQITLILRLIGLGFLIGLGLSLGFVFLRDFFDKTVRTPKEIEDKLMLRVMASIPVIENGYGEKPELEFIEKNQIDPNLIASDYSPSPIGEAYRSLRTQLLYLKDKSPFSTILITSLNPGEGKSLNASNLAITFAQQKLPTILMDGDLRRGVLHNTFACHKKPGLSDILYGKESMTQDNIKRIIQNTHIPNLFLISSGMNVPNPSEILGSSTMEHLIQILKRHFSMVIIDTPPIWVTSDAVIISKLVDGALLIVRSAKTHIDRLKEKLVEYNPLVEKLKGVIFTFAEHETLKESYKYSYYNY